MSEAEVVTFAKEMSVPVDLDSSSQGSALNSRNKFTFQAVSQHEDSEHLALNESPDFLYDLFPVVQKNNKPKILLPVPNRIL